MHIFEHGHTFSCIEIWTYLYPYECAVHHLSRNIAKCRARVDNFFVANQIQCQGRLKISVALSESVQKPPIVILLCITIYTKDYRIPINGRLLKYDNVTAIWQYMIPLVSILFPMYQTQKFSIYLDLVYVWLWDFS